MKKIYKKIISLFLIFGLFFSNLGFYKVEKAEAVDLSNIVGNVLVGYAVCWAQGQVASFMSTGAIDVLSVPTNGIGEKTIEASSTAKECGFDYAANAIKSELLHGIMKDTINWVKGGYEGEPAFMTNPDQFLGDITDKYVGKIIESDERTKFLCEGFKLPYKFALNTQFYSPNASGNMRSGESPVQVPQCTLSKAVQNSNNAFSDLSNFYVNYDQNYNNTKDADYVVDVNKYFDEFIKANSNSGNDIYSATLMTMQSAENAIARENQQKLDDVKRGDGYLSLQRCKYGNSDTYSIDSKNKQCTEQLDECKKSADGNSDAIKLCNEEFNKCFDSDRGKKYCEYVTPGKMISSEISSVLGMEREEIQLADEFDELIAAIITNLISKVFDENKGLAGVTDNNQDGSSDFEPAEKKDISVEKSAILKQYSPRAYDIQLKIYQSLLDALEPKEYKGNDILNRALEEEVFWTGKTDKQIDTIRKLEEYWDSLGVNLAHNSNWSVPFVSYVTNSGIVAGYNNDGLISSITKKNFSEIDNSSKIENGSIICDLRDRKNNYCGVVVKNNSSTVEILTKIKDTLGRISFNKVDLVVDKFRMFNSLNVEKYNREYVNNLFGDNKYIVKKDDTQIDKDTSKNFLKLLEGILNQWKVLKHDAETDSGRKYVVRDQNQYVTEVLPPFAIKPTMEIEKVVSKIKNITAVLSVEDIKMITKLRDKTIRDREAVLKMVEKVKAATTREELWDSFNDKIKPDLGKAYRIYMNIKNKIGNWESITKDVLGEKTIGSAELESYNINTGIVPYMWMMESGWLPGHLKTKEFATNLGLRCQGKPLPGVQRKDCIEWTEPWREDGLEELKKEFESGDKDYYYNRVKNSYLKEIAEIKLSYDPTNDISNYSSGLSDESDYNYNSI